MTEQKGVGWVKSEVFLNSTSSFPDWKKKWEQSFGGVFPFTVTHQNEELTIP